MVVNSTCPSSFPLTQLDQSVISGIATGDAEAQNKSLIKIWCQTFTNTVRPTHIHICTKYPQNINI